MPDHSPAIAPQEKKKVNWLQWLMILCFAVVGILFGKLMVETMEAAEVNGASPGQVMLVWIGLMVGMYAVLFLHIVFHEGGHLIFG